MFTKVSMHFLFSVLIAAVMASCATTVTFDVEHPPLVDLRGIRSITIIPFEKNSIRGYEHFSPYVTAALTKGIENSLVRGNISFVDPGAMEDTLTLADIPDRDLWQYADAYLTGRIIDITFNISTVAPANQNIYTNTGTAIVYIEYSYIRARDGKILKTFSKESSFSDSINIARDRRYFGSRSNARRRDQQRQRSEWYDMGQFDHDRRQQWFPDNSVLRLGPWEDRLVRSAIERFSLGMYQELSPWSSTEERKLQKRAGDNPVLNEVKSLVKMHRYDQALQIYQEIYKQNSNVYAGYNNAVLLAANGKYSEALELLEDINKMMKESGQRIPRVIRKEIQRIAAIIDGTKLLEEYRLNRNAANVNASAPKPEPSVNSNEPANTRVVRGTVNLNPVTVYALRETISSVTDVSVWTKIVASAEASSVDTNALGCEWSFRIPITAPSSLWFAVASGSSMYITQTALRTSGTVVLDTARMTMLE